MIVRTFYRRGIIETWGRGTPKIARLMLEARTSAPIIFQARRRHDRDFRIAGKIPAGCIGGGNDRDYSYPSGIRTA